MREESLGVKAASWAIVIGALLLIVFGGLFSCAACAGDGSWGMGANARVVECVVTSKHVDISGSGDYQASHYMVTTDQGVFEIDNGIIMGIWNADELYGRLEVGKRYRIVVQGDTTTAFWTQTYPFVQAVEGPIGE